MLRQTVFSYIKGFYFQIKHHLFSFLSRVTLATAHWERKVSQVTRGLRVVPAALVSPASATSEHPAFAESLETLEYRGCQGHQVYLDREVSDDMCVCVCVCVRACVFDFVRQSLKESVCVCVCVCGCRILLTGEPPRPHIHSIIRSVPSSKYCSYHSNLILTPSNPSEDISQGHLVPRSVSRTWKGDNMALVRFFFFLSHKSSSFLPFMPQLQQQTC